METTDVKCPGPMPGRLAARPRRRAARLAGAGIAAFLALAALTAPPAAADLPRPVPPLFGGIQVNEPDHRTWVASLRDSGMDSLQVTLYARQGRWDAAELAWAPEFPAVVAELRAARRAGLRTVLVLRVALERGLESNRHLWHGMIWPRDSELDAWFARYREFAVMGAELAAREGVDLLAVGSELSALTSTVPVSAPPDLYAYFMDPTRVDAVNATLRRCADAVQRRGRGDDLQHLDGGRYPTLADMLAGEAAARGAWARTVVAGNTSGLAAFNQRRQRHEQAWRELIDVVRDVYSGPLTYGANFDQFADVGFWDALDAVGVNAYFALGLYGLDPAARTQRLRSSWERVAAAIESAAAGLPVLFLELGWTRRQGATVRPYSYDRVEVLETAPDGAELTCVHWATQPLDPGERLDAMRALASTVAAGRFSTLRGVQLWKLTTRPEHRAIEPFAIGVGAAADAADREMLVAAAAIAGNVRARHPGVTTQQDDELSVGEEIFLSECASCHGNRGKGDGPAARFYDPPPRDLTSGEWRYAQGGTKEAVARVVAAGVDDTAMEPFEGVLTDEEIAAVARWVVERVATGQAEASTRSDG